MTRYAIGLGSNLGDRRQHLTDACRELAGRFGQLTVSPIYETEPVGGPRQEAFLNAVAVLETELAPLEVLDVCQQIEDLQGRERQVRWGPRTLDLDVIATDGSSHSDDRLTIPHPRAADREFVLRPLSDVWPDAPVGGGVTAVEAVSRVDDQGVRFVIGDWFTT